MARRTRATERAAEYRAQVVQMRSVRLTFAEIGRRMGVTGQRAGQLYREALAEVHRMDTEENRQEELGLVDTATSRLMAIAMDTSVSPRTRVEAWSGIRQWAEHKAKLLGLNAAVKHEVITLDYLDQQIAQLSAEVAAGSAAAEAAGVGG